MYVFLFLSVSYADGVVSKEAAEGRLAALPDTPPCQGCRPLCKQQADDLQTCCTEGKDPQENDVCFSLFQQRTL